MRFKIENKNNENGNASAEVVKAVAQFIDNIIDIVDNYDEEIVLESLQKQIFKIKK